MSSTSQDIYQQFQAAGVPVSNVQDVPGGVVVYCVGTGTGTPYIVSVSAPYAQADITSAINAANAKAGS